MRNGIVKNRRPPIQLEIPGDSYGGLPHFSHSLVSVKVLGEGFGRKSDEPTKGLKQRASVKLVISDMFSLALSPLNSGLIYSMAGMKKLGPFLKLQTSLLVKLII